MVVLFLASGGIGVAVASCPPLCSPRPLKQPPLSAAFPRELIYNAHLGNTKGLLSSLRFNVFSPQVAVLSFLHVISLPPSFPPTSFSLSPFAPRAPFFTSVISRYSSTFYSLFIVFFCRVDSRSPQNNELVRFFYDSFVSKASKFLHYSLFDVLH